MKKNILTLTAACLFLFSQAQTDTLKLCYYNILNYPGSTGERWEYFETIMQEMQPDILLVNEILDETGANTLLNSALNTGDINHYQKANFVNGYDSDNLLFFNGDKITLASQHEINTALRDINHYKVYHLSGNDTTFLNLFSCHLKAGTGSTNEAKRLGEIQDFFSYINSKPNLENIILGGDMNFYDNQEPAYQEITIHSSHKLYDVLTAADWHDDISYTDIHTQSTRKDYGAPGGGATGGLDDRFDFIFFDQNIMNFESNVQYIDNSYKAFGNDETGACFNQSLLFTANSMYSSTLVDALYNMSDHLPVLAKLQIGDIATNLKKHNNNKVFYVSPNPSKGQIIISFTSIPQSDKTLDIFNSSGQLIKSFNIKNNDLHLRLPAGLYYIKHQHTTQKIVIY